MGVETPSPTADVLPPPVAGGGAEPQDSYDPWEFAPRAPPAGTGPVLQPEPPCQQPQDPLP
eukprot:7420762-Alexandrium_andersonii.AAC.1